MEHILYWLWLTTKYGVTPSKIKVLLEYFKTVEEIYFSKNFNNIYGLSDKIKSSLADKDLSKAEKILEQTAKLNQKILVYDSESYPQILKNISSPPYVLYVQGKVLELDKVLTIGVVGTRNSSEYGRVVTDRICRELAQYGAVTIGGLARGIDTVGAWATLDVGGVAVGVVGNGLDIVYPSENVELVKAITEKGCIISEYAPGTPPVRNHFPARNRIIAGLSRGILVTEAPEKSGALITAKYALENDRDVFAVPRNITDTKIPFLELSLHTLKIKVMLRTFYRKYLPNCTVIRKLSKQTNTKSDGLLGFPLTYRRIILNLFGIRKEIYLIMRFLKPATFHIQTITRGMSCWKWF